MPIPSALQPASYPEIEGVAVAEPPPAILADKIDPVTGDFASLFESHPLAAAFVIEAMRVQRGTGAAVRELGHGFRGLTHVENDAPEMVESLAREALTDAEAAGVAEVVAVTVEPDETDRAQLNTVIHYRDLLAPAEARPRRLVFPR